MADSLPGDRASDDSGLENLGESDRKETQEILDAIAQEENKEGDKGQDPEDPAAKEAADKKAADEKAAAEAKAEEDRKAAEAGKEGKPGDVEPPKRGKLMPAWVHERAIAEKQKAIDELTEKLNNKPDDQSGKKEPTQEEQAALEAEIKATAEKHKLDPELVKSLIDMGRKYGGTLPPEITQKLAKLDDITLEREVAAEEQLYTSNFDKEVLPLVKKEFGDDVPADTISQIRDELKNLAYTETYKQTPLAVIFKGVERFREFKRPPAGSGEAGRGGFQQHGGGGEGGKGGDGSEFANVTEADIAKMDGETFDRYSKWQETTERTRRSSS